jgi:hypothetical protein
MSLHLAGRGQVNAGAGLPFPGTAGTVGRLPGAVPGRVPLRPPLAPTVAIRAEHWEWRSITMHLLLSRPWFVMVAMNYHTEFCMIFYLVGGIIISRRRFGIRYGGWFQIEGG